MKKAWCLIIAAAIITSGTAFAEPAETEASAETGGVLTKAYTEAEQSETELPGQTAYAQAKDGDYGASLLASIDGIMFEYDYASSTELVRVIKVKYDQTYFTNGINSFNTEISVPERCTASVACTTKLTGFDISESYSNGVYSCIGVCDSDQKPSDGCLFTIRITLKEKILNPITISLTGNTSVGDASGITQSLTNGGLNAVSCEIPASADDSFGGVDGAVTWVYSDEKLLIHGNGTMKDYAQGEAPWYKECVQRNKLNSVKSIEFTEDRLQNIGQNAFYGFDKASSVSLSGDISTINDSAFEGCSSLKNISIPETAGVGIGNYAFKNCSSLTSVYVPAGVRTIGRGAFEGCTRLTSMTLPFIGSQKGESNSKNTFAYIFNDSVPASLATVSVTDEATVPENAFAGCGRIKNIYINSEVSTLGTGAFKDCASLTEFKIPGNAAELPDDVFKGCSGLKRVEGMENISSVGKEAFDGCSSLEEIILSDKMTEIKDFTFRGCSSLTAVEIPVSVAHIGNGVLSGCTKLSTVRMPFVGANADPGSTSVTPEGVFGYLFGTADNTQIPASVTKVEVTGTDRNNYIPKEAFKNCANIEDIIIDGGRSVLDNAFENCKFLKNLYIPKSVSIIGNTILKDCTNIKTLTVPFIGTNRLDRNTASSVVGGFFGYNDTDANGTLQYYDGNRNYHYYKIPSTLKNVSVLNQTEIPVGAFMKCDFIENISIVTGAALGDYAFNECFSLQSVTLPSDMQTIGEQAFAVCESLETVNIPNRVKAIGSNAFYNCRELKNVTMPDSVTEIAEDVFNGTNLFGAAEVSLMEADTGSLLASEGAIICSEGSAAHKFALEHGIAVRLADSAELNATNVGANMSKHSTGEYFVDVTDPNNLTGTVYAELYNASGRLVAVQRQETSADESEYRFEFSTEDSAKASYAKVFVWSGKNGMVPQLTNAAEVHPN